MMAVRLLFTVLALFSLFSTATAAELHTEVVVKDAVNYTPQLIATSAVPRPHIDALARVGATIYAGGLFRAVSNAAGTQTYRVQHFVAFDAATGRLRLTLGSGYKDPVFKGQIWAMAALGDSVFVGGEFTTVNGLARRSLVKIDAKTGAVIARFNAGFAGGTVWDLKIWNGPDGNTPMLIVGGSMGRKLIALDPRTGAEIDYFRLGISNAIPDAWGGVAVYSIAINPQGTKLVATGNFQTVGDRQRTRLFVADLTGPQATLDPWYYPGFSKPCGQRKARRIAYLQGVDFAPSGAYFVVTATGGAPAERADIWPSGSAKYHTVCDAAARFNLNDDRAPVWVNYTGGDSVWTVAVTGAAVYVQGHFEWLDNPQGRKSQDGGGAARRQGIGAISPHTGKALPWNPAKPAVLGGKAFLTTADGLWVGSDSPLFAGEAHRGLAFVPLP